MTGKEINGNSKTSINWYPGHMAKALSQMSEEVKHVDMVIYVLDGRAPFSCLNPEFSAMVGDKPILYVINKADLSDAKKVEKCKEMLLQNKKCNCVVLNSTLSGADKQILPIMKTLCALKIKKYALKGLNIHLRAMVIGVPNCGKSTLINNLCRVKKTVTGDRPGVTKGKQWLRLSNGFEIMDTPGTLWPKFENAKIASNLAILGSIKDEVVDSAELAIYLLNTVIPEYETNICNRYAISVQEKSALEIIEEIAKSKHFVLKGNEIDYDRACFFILDDFRKGKLGKITLD